MTASAIGYAGIPIDGSAASTRALTRRLGRVVAQLARATGSPATSQPEDQEPEAAVVDVEADTEPGE